MIVYIIDRDGELDVFEDLADAQEAQRILGGADACPIVEQVVFGSREPGRFLAQQGKRPLRADVRRLERKSQDTSVFLEQLEVLQ